MSRGEDYSHDEPVDTSFPPFTSRSSRTQTPPTEEPVSRRSSISEDSDATERDHLEARNVEQALQWGSSRRPARQAEEEVELLGGRDEGGPPRKAWAEGRWKIGGVPLPRPLILLISLPFLLLFTAFSLRSRRPHLPLALLSNGTHPFYPTTILVSLDGFRPSYFDTHAHALSNLIRLSTAEDGLRAEHMTPVFPTLTFPNHWALLTGLYPAWSGIVANDFWDPQSEEEFFYSDPERSWDAGWWWGEPVWSVVERYGGKAANIMWPGPPTTSSGISPSHFVPFREQPPISKSSQILTYLDLPLDDRPQLITAYMPDIDAAGHLAGPESPAVDQALRDVDAAVGELMEGLEGRNLGAVVNLVVVSDHGMAATSNDRLIYLDDILGEPGVDAIAHRDGWPSVGLRFKDGSDEQGYIELLQDAAKKSNGSFAVYTSRTMPDRWHFYGSPRIAPVYIVPALGWGITDHHEHEVLLQGDYRPKGNHGYDNTYAEMRAIFLAQGPFVQRLKDKERESEAQKGWASVEPYVMTNFGNLEIYSLVLRLLGLEQSAPPHNGTAGFWDQYF